MTSFVTTNLSQRPIPVMRANDPLAIEVYGYVARLREQAQNLRSDADALDAAADRAEPIQVDLSGALATAAVEKGAGRIDALRIEAGGVLTVATRLDGQIEAGTSDSPVVLDSEAVTRLVAWLSEHAS